MIYKCHCTQWAPLCCFRAKAGSRNRKFLGRNSAETQQLANPSRLPAKIILCTNERGFLPSPPPHFVSLQVSPNTSSSRTALLPFPGSGSIFHSRKLAGKEHRHCKQRIGAGPSQEVWFALLPTHLSPFPTQPSSPQFRKQHKKTWPWASKVNSL